MFGIAVQAKVYGRGLEGVPPNSVVPLTERGIVFVGARKPSHATLKEALVVLDDPTVASGNSGHCRIGLAGSVVTVVDCGSDNGTWINRGGRATRVSTRGPATVLKPGDELFVGRAKLRVVESA